MKKTITLTAWRRPRYLRQIVSDLSKNQCEGWKLYCSLEPGPPAVSKICNEIDFVEREVIVNKRRLGVRDNPFSVLRKAFEAGSDVNVYLEEDITISADVLNIAEWYRENADLSKELCCLLHVKSKCLHPPNHVKHHRGFAALGLVILKEQWNNHFYRNWHKHKSGWDWAIHGYLNRHEKMRVLSPWLSRSTHIGVEGGTYFRQERHGKEFEGLKLYEGPPRPEKDYIRVQE